MRLYVLEVEQWERSSFASLSADHDIAFCPNALTEQNAHEFADAEAISTFIYSDITRAVLNAMPRLRLITTRSTGFNHIDVAACQERGITICNVPSYGETTVAEHVFGLLLMISHQLEEAVNRTRRGDFSPRGLQGFDLHGKTIGVIGTGAIGIATIRIALGFSMRVIAYDVRPKEELAKQMGFQYSDLDNLLQQSDIITLHVPSMAQTRHMMGEQQFAKMKHGAILINTARGELVDVRALARALADGKIKAAGLDVLANEPVIREEAELLRSVYEQKHDLAALLADQVLIHMKNVIVTPHSAFNTREAILRILDVTVENILSFAKNSPINTI
jgi:D-lactate dehydrogenase